MTKSLLLSLIITFSSLFVSAEARPSAENVIQQLVKAGNEANLQGDVESALAIGKSLQRRFTESPAGFVLNLNILTTALSWDEAATVHDEAITQLVEQVLELCQEPHSEQAAMLHACGTAHFSLSYLHGARGRAIASGRAAKRAKRALDKSLQLAPDNDDARLHLGLINYYTKNLPPFARLLGRMLWVVPRSEPSRGLPFVEAAANSDGAYADSARFVLSDLYRQEGELALALPLLSDLVACYPGNSRIHFNYVELLLDMGSIALATEALSLLQPSLLAQPEFILLSARAALLNSDRTQLQRALQFWSELEEAPKAAWMEEMYLQLLAQAEPFIDDAPGT